MGQFRRDTKTGVWGFHIPRSKGGKKRTVAVSNQLLKALQRYRRFLGLPPLPVPNEDTPLFVRHRFFFQAEDGIRHLYVTGVQTCALPIWRRLTRPSLPNPGTGLPVFALSVMRKPSRVPNTIWGGSSLSPGQ